jgi:hypothetical protein
VVLDPTTISALIVITPTLFGGKGGDKSFRVQVTDLHAVCGVFEAANGGITQGGTKTVSPRVAVNHKHAHTTPLHRNSRVLLNSDTKLMYERHLRSRQA